MPKRKHKSTVSNAGMTKIPLSPFPKPLLPFICSLKPTPFFPGKMPHMLLLLIYTDMLLLVCHPECQGQACRPSSSAAYACQHRASWPRGSPETSGLHCCFLAGAPGQPLGPPPSVYLLSPQLLDISSLLGRCLLQHSARGHMRMGPLHHWVKPKASREMHDAHVTLMSKPFLLPSIHALWL